MTDEGSIEAIYGVESNDQDEAVKQAVEQLEEDLNLDGNPPFGYEVWRVDYYDLEDPEMNTGVGLNVELMGSVMPEHPSNPEVVSEIPTPV